MPLKLMRQGFFAGILSVLTLIRSLFWSKNKEQERYLEKKGISPFWLILTVILAIIGTIAIPCVRSVWVSLWLRAITSLYALLIFARNKLLV